MCRQECIQIKEGFEGIPVPIVVVENVKELLEFFRSSFEGEEPGNSLTEFQLR